MKRVILLSGGLDSSVLLHCYPKETMAVTFLYPSKHNSREVDSACLQASRLGVPHRLVHLPALDFWTVSSLIIGGPEIPTGHYQDPVQEPTIVPFRNGVMLSSAVCLAESIGAEEVLFAAHAGDAEIYPDCRPEFVHAFNESVRIGTKWKVGVSAPFLKRTKSDIVALGIERRVDFSITWTCCLGKDNPCGRCGACVERREAFLNNNTKDPLEKT